MNLPMHGGNVKEQGVCAESAVDMKPCDRSSMHQPLRAARIEAARACSRQSEHPNVSDAIQSISFRPRAPRQDA